jgi:hypothetical protein
MVRLQSILTGVFTGILFTVSWVIFIDAQIMSHDSFPPTHILPPLFASIGAVCINMVTLKKVSEHLAAKVWVFIWLTDQMLCVGAAIFILTTDYAVTDNYAGVAILLQTILCMMSSFIFFAGKSKSGDI